MKEFYLNPSQYNKWEYQQRENKKGLKTYTIINKYLCECGLLNEKNVCNALMKYMKRKNAGGVKND